MSWRTKYNTLLKSLQLHTRSGTASCHPYILMYGYWTYICVPCCNSFWNRWIYPIVLLSSILLSFQLIGSTQETKARCFPCVVNNYPVTVSSGAVKYAPLQGEVGHASTTSVLCGSAMDWSPKEQFQGGEVANTNNRWLWQVWLSFIKYSCFNQSIEQLLYILFIYLIKSS